MLNGYDSAQQFSGAAVRDAGGHFIMRYLSHSAWKNVTAREIADCHRHQVATGFVWETTARRPLSGAAGGAQDAHEARQMAHQLGVPDSVSIFYACDFDARWEDVAPYFRAVRRADPTAGVYGSFGVCSGAWSAMTMPLWQTAAWSHGKRHARCSVYQFARTVVVGHTQADVCQATGWGPALWLPGVSPSWDRPPARTPGRTQPTIGSIARSADALRLGIRALKSEAGMDNPPWEETDSTLAGIAGAMDKARSGIRQLRSHR